MKLCEKQHAFLYTYSAHSPFLQPRAGTPAVNSFTALSTVKDEFAGRVCTNPNLRTAVGKSVSIYKRNRCCTTFSSRVLFNLGVRSVKPSITFVRSALTFHATTTSTASCFYRDLSLVHYNTSSNTQDIKMLAESFVAALALLGGATAQGGAGVNQLETPRLTQAAQRAEFGVEGAKSAFKFSFADPVRSYALCIRSVLYGVWAGCCKFALSSHVHSCTELVHDLKPCTASSVCL